MCGLPLLCTGRYAACLIYMQAQNIYLVETKCKKAKCMYFLIYRTYCIFHVRALGAHSSSTQLQQRKSFSGV